MSGKPGRGGNRAFQSGCLTHVPGLGAPEVTEWTGQTGKPFDNNQNFPTRDRPEMDLRPLYADYKMGNLFFIVFLA